MRHVAFFVLLISIGNAGAASFDCSINNLNPIELKICSDPDLSEMDGLLAVYYKHVLKNTNAGSEIQDAQRQWIKERDRCLNESRCLVNVYRNRIIELGKKILADPKKVVSPQLFTAADVMEVSLKALPTCNSSEDINLDGRNEITCLPRCGGPACSDYYFVSQPEGYSFFPELSMGSNESLYILKKQDVRIPALEKQPGYKNNTINGWRILYSTYGEIEKCYYSATYYAYAAGKYNKVYSKRLDPPWNGR